VSQRGCLVSFDARLTTLAVPGGGEAFFSIAAAQPSHAHRLHTLDADFRGLGGDIELIKKLA
jgi:hypothetical protein